MSFGIGFMALFVYLIPLGTLVITLLLGLRFVKAAERMAAAAETLARNAGSARLS